MTPLRPMEATALSKARFTWTNSTSAPALPVALGDLRGHDLSSVVDRGRRRGLGGWFSGRPSTGELGRGRVQQLPGMHTGRHDRTARPRGAVSGGRRACAPSAAAPAALLLGRGLESRAAFAQDLVVTDHGGDMTKRRIALVGLMAGLTFTGSAAGFGVGRVYNVHPGQR